VTRRRCLFLPVLGLTGCVRPNRPAALKGADYLWSAQLADGGWHSKTYGLLRSGQSLTPFVLDALLEVPEVSHPAKVDAAIAFIAKNTRQDGALGLADAGVPDYPNYATALAVSALCRARRPGWEAQIVPMVLWLRGQQFSEQNGWREADPVYGAWGMGGEKLHPPDTGHVDLSMTRYVLGALRASGVPAGDPVFAKARIFVERCQNFEPQKTESADGGFFFSTTEFDTNKAGHDGNRFRSYGTTTADGILALVATGGDSGRIAAAQHWLSERHRDMEVPGFVGDAYRRWPGGLSFYYAAVSTQAFRILNADPGPGLAASLERAQRADGSWANSENLVKEDDPLIATAFAIRALASHR
jgi:hypothetical protein